MTNRTGLLKRSPLKYVVASLRFAPLPLLASKIPEIQDAMREIAPLMHTIEVTQMPSPGQSSSRPGTVKEAWMLLSSDKNFGIQFASDQLLMFTKTYERYSTFIETYRHALKTLLNHMHFIDVLNMGVRYIDHIKAEPGEKLDDYISSSFLPPTAEGHESIGATIMAQYVKNDSTLRVTAVSMPGMLPVPQDILGLLMMVNPQDLKLNALGKNELILDMDAIVTFEKAQRMKEENILETLDNLHSIANGFFRQPDVFSDHAFSKWKGET